MSQARVIVVGAGAGGLAAALDLARAGLDVLVLERAPVPGGKLRELAVGPARIDSGPTVLTMKWVFEELFAACGARLDERVELTPATVLARHAWSESERLDLFADPARTAEAIGDFAGAVEARGFEAFRRRAREVYETLEASFIRAARPTPLDLVRNAGGVIELLRIKPFETLWRELGRYFRDPRLQQLFGRYATYCGSSPFLAPATLMLVAHVELEGVFHVGGGMQRLPEAMARLAGEKGARFRYDTTVTDVAIERGRISAVVLDTGERLEADAVLLNADTSTLAAGHLGRAAAGVVGRVAPAARSLSALTVSLLAPTQGFPLLRHNVFFGAGYASEFDDLLVHRRLPRDPTVYLCAQDRDDAGAPSPSTSERLFCIVNAPPTGDQHPPAESEVESCLNRAFDRLSRCGLQIARTQENSRITTPADFERRFPGTGGALYGRATHGAMATFQRAEARTSLPGLYLAGGSVHPGPGVPMAALSGRLAARALLQDLASSARSPPAGTPGGTSTP